MSTNIEIGTRVKNSLNGRSQAWLAEQVSMPTDSMSRSLNGHRGFSSIEVAKIADALAVDIYWLITGLTDPLKLTIAARHDYDPVTGNRSNIGRETDESELNAVALAYRQAHEVLPVVSDPLPDNPTALREALRDGFVRDFADRLEERLDVDVIRLQGLSTAYSFTMAGRRVIVLPARGNWWRSNFDLAHEIAHLALGHHVVDPDGDVDVQERAANQFASELLLPRSVIESSLGWEVASQSDVAQFLWDCGVGTTALANRLQSLGIHVRQDVAALLDRPMPGALRPHQTAMDLPRPGGSRTFLALYDPIDARMQESSRRRFPSTLITAHRRRVESDGINPATLAWMLEGPVDDLVEEPVEATLAPSLSDIFGV